MSIAMPLSCHFHLHEVCFSIPSFSIYMCLSHKWVSCREHIVGYCFIIQSVSICLLIRAFSPLTFKVIINKYVFIAILSLSSSWFCISSLFLSFCFSFCGFDLCFPDDKQCWASFHMPPGHLLFLFGKMSVTFLSSTPISFLKGLPSLNMLGFEMRYVWEVFCLWILT